MIVGTIYLFAGATAPEGFLICDGSAVSRSTYSELFSAISDTFGSGDGTTTFNVPDLSGRVPIGSSLSHSFGTTGGEESHVLIEGEIPAHTHGIASHGHANNITATTPKLTHSVTQPAYNYNKPNSTRASKSSASNTYAGVTSTNASRTANVKINNHTAAACTKTGGVTDCDAFDTSDTGLAVAHSNMQPFITMNYVIYAGV